MLSNQVLIIEDDRMLAGYFEAVLKMAGMQVEVVYTAREGLARLATASPNLILLDLHLGNEINGKDILYQIRSNPRLDNIRVIIVTGFPGTAELVHDLADLVLIKPVGIDQLTKLAQRMMTYDVPQRMDRFRDPLTGLFKMEFFHTRLELAFERAKRRPEFLYAVILLQVSLAGEDADIVGHNVDGTSEMLRGIAKRLNQNLRPTDCIAHLSAWKFASLNEDLRGSEDAQVIIGRIQNCLAEPYEWKGDYYKIETRVGFAVANPQYRKPEDILSAAEGMLEQSLTNTREINESA